MPALTVVYGSQTGTAQELSEYIGRQGRRRALDVRVTALDDYQLGLLISQTLTVFVCSTTGQGDPPDNMRLFWNLLMRRGLAHNALQGLRFAVIGLGDSSYQKYNFVAKKLYRRLLQLGAEPLLELALGDDQNSLGPDATVLPWLDSFWGAAAMAFPAIPSATVIPDEQLLPAKYRITVVSGVAAQSRFHPGQVESSVGPYTEHRPFYSTVLHNERVTAADHFQDVRLVRFDLSSSGISYEPGDVLCVQPSNLPELVDRFLSLFGLDPDEAISIEANINDAVVPQSLASAFTWQYAAENYFDLGCVPQQHFFELLALCAASGHTAGRETSSASDADSQLLLEHDKLLEFASAAGTEERYAYCNRPRRNIVETLSDFPRATSCVPRCYLFDLVGPLKPRAFSIASSQKVLPGTVEILMAVVQYKTRLAVPRRGVCTTWLANTAPLVGSRVPIWVKPGTVQFPTATEVPLLMIGPGTGVAPFRSAIQDRCARGVGGNVLVFGCRSQHSDYYFKHEWAEYEQRGLLTVLTAFSRDQSDKYYVQHAIVDNAALVWRLLDKEQSSLFVAGNARRMPDDVRAAVVKVVETQGGRTAKDSEAYLLNMERCRRYQLECWS